MGDVVNLNNYRKRLAKQHARERAVENRARHGRGRGQRQGATADANRVEAELDGKRLESKPFDRKAGAGSDDTAPNTRHDANDADDAG